MHKTELTNAKNAPEGSRHRSGNLYSAEAGGYRALGYAQDRLAFLQDRAFPAEGGDVVQRVALKWDNGKLIRAGYDPDRRKTLGCTQEKRASLRDRAIPAASRDVVQGVFLKWEGGKLVRADDYNPKYLNTEKMLAEEIISQFPLIDDMNLIHEISMEMAGKLYEIKTAKDLKDVVARWSFLEPSKYVSILENLNADCLNWLWKTVNYILKPENRHEFRNYKGWVQTTYEQLKPLYNVQDTPGEISEGEKTQDLPAESSNRLADAYQALKGQIERLSQSIGEVAALKIEDPKAQIDPKAQKAQKAQIDPKAQKAQKAQIDPKAQKAQKDQLTRIIGWQIIGYLRLLKRYEKDDLMSQPAGEFRQLLQKFEEDLGMKLPELCDPDQAAASISPSTEKTYAAELSQTVEPPPRNQLEAGTCINDYPNSNNRGPDDINNIAYIIIDILRKPKSSERLVIYRSSPETEAIEILRFFNSGQAAFVENEISKNKGLYPVREGGIAQIGPHLGDRAQAESYDTVKSGSLADVTLAYILKPGAKELLFSQAMIGLPEGWGGQKKGLARAKGGEGKAKQGKTAYIGIKPESEGRYSFVVSGDSRALLQLLVDRVEVVRILYKDLSNSNADPILLYRDQV